MALPLQSSSHLLPKSPIHHLHRKPTFLAKSQTPSASQNPTTNGHESTTTATEPSSALAPPRKPTFSGLGFGSSPSKNKAAVNSASSRKRTKDQKTSTGKRPSPVVRRPPAEKPTFVLEQAGGRESEEQKRSGANFFLAWLGLGSAILIEGVVLSASGFLPEGLDNFFTKYLYPTFTPAVILFFAGAIAFGVSNYRQNEKLKGKK